MDPETDDPSTGGRGAAAVAVVFLVLLAVAGAVIPFVGLRALGLTLAQAAGGAVVVFPVLPAIWHFAAERRRQLDLTGASRSGLRFALRALAVSCLVAAGALATVGPRAEWALVLRAVGRATGASSGDAATRAVPAPIAAPVRSGSDPLEALIPSDATLVVASRGPTLLREWLAASNGAPGELQALGKCGLNLEAAFWLFASRPAGTRLVAVRLPGVGEERNLYCFAGAVGDGRVRVRVDRSAAAGAANSNADQLTIEGLPGGRPLTFTRLDADTLLLVDPDWRAVVEERRRGPDQAQPAIALGAALDRVDRRGVSWAAARVATGGRTWDVAIDAKVVGPELLIRASSVATDTGERAEASFRAPTSFAASLPAGVFARGASALFGVTSEAAAPPPAPARSRLRTTGGEIPPVPPQP